MERTSMGDKVADCGGVSAGLSCWCWDLAGGDEEEGGEVDEEQDDEPVRDVTVSDMPDKSLAWSSA